MLLCHLMWWKCLCCQQESKTGWTLSVTCRWWFTHAAWKIFQLLDHMWAARTQQCTIQDVNNINNVQSVCLKDELTNYHWGIRGFVFIRIMTNSAPLIRTQVSGGVNFVFYFKAKLYRPALFLQWRHCEVRSVRQTAFMLYLWHQARCSTSRL